MKVKELLFGLLCTLALSTTFISCSDDDNQWNDNGSTVNLPQTRAFILNEGSYGKNNASIAFYAPNKDSENGKNFLSDIYFIQNSKKLGDTGQDIIEYNGSLYVVVYGSKLLLKLNAAGVEENRISFSETDGAPRYIVAKDKKLYVTLYSGKVARIDAKTLNIEAYVNVNSNPEQIVIKDGKLYVANSGWGKGSTVSVINISDFKKENDINVILNPNLMLEANDEIYVISWGNYADIPYSFQRIKTDGSYERIAAASSFTEYNDIIYLLYSNITNWTDYTAENTFSTYNTKTHKMNNQSFLKTIPDDLKSKVLRGISFDEKTGDIYILTANKTSNGDIYRFKNDGTFIEKFDCGGMSPSKIIFLQ